MGSHSIARDPFTGIIAFFHERLDREANEEVREEARKCRDDANRVFYGIAFLSNPQKYLLVERTREYCRAYFVDLSETVSEKEQFRSQAPQNKTIEEIGKLGKELLKQQNQRQAEENAYAHRYVRASELTRDEAWNRFHEEAKPFWVLFVDSVNEKFDILVSRKFLTSKERRVGSVFDAERQQKIKLLQESYQKIASFLPYSPKALLKAWRLLIEIDTQVSQVSKKDVEMLKKKCENSGIALEEYLKRLLETVKEEELKIFQRTKKMLDELTQQSSLTEYDPLHGINEEFKALEMDAQLPPYLCKVDGEDLQALVDLMVGRAAIRDERAFVYNDQKWLSSFKEGVRIRTATLSIHAQLGPCKQGSVCYPESFPDREKIKLRVHRDHSWPDYRGPSPFSVWLYNRYGLQYSVDKKQEHLFKLLKILVKELDTLKTQLEKKGRDEVESSFKDAWAGVFMEQGRRLFEYLTVADILTALNPTPFLKSPLYDQMLEIYLQIKQLMAQISLFGERAIPWLQLLEKSNGAFESTILARYLSAAAHGIKEEEKYWEGLIEKTLTSKLAASFKLLTGFLSGAQKVPLEEAVKALTGLLPTGAEAEEKAKKILREFLQTKYIFIKSTEEPLYDALKVSDKWKIDAESLETKWEGRNKKGAGSAFRSILYALEAPDTWMPVDSQMYSSLDPEEKKRLLTTLEDYFTRSFVTPHEKWETLLILLKEPQLTLLYLRILLKRRFDQLMETKERVQLIRSCPEILVQLQKWIPDNFRTNLLNGLHEKQANLETYVDTFFDEDTKRKICLELDRIVFDRVVYLSGASLPDPSALAHVLGNYYASPSHFTLSHSYPRDRDSKEKLRIWLQGFTPACWHPGIWRLIDMLGRRHHEWQETAREWRYEGLVQSLQERELAPVVELLPLPPEGISLDQGYYQLLLGQHFGEKFINHLKENLSLYHLWRAAHPAHLAAWDKLLAELTHGLTAEAGLPLQKTYRKHFTYPLGEALEGKRDELETFVVRNLSEYLQGTSLFPADVPASWIYAALSCVALRMGRRWIEGHKGFQKLLLEGFCQIDKSFKPHGIPYGIPYGTWEEMVQRHPQLAPFRQCWELVTRRQIETAQRWAGSLDSRQFVESLQHTSDWLTAALDNCALFDLTQLQIYLKILPVQYRAQLVSQLFGSYIPCLTAYSCIALALFKRYLTEDPCPEDTQARIHFYQRLTLCIVLAQDNSREAQAYIEQMGDVLRGAEIKPEWFQPLVAEDIYRQVLRGHKWKGWQSLLTDWLQPVPYFDGCLISWMVGSCNPQDVFRAVLNGNDASPMDLMVDSYQPHHAALFFEDVFLGTLFGIALPPLDLIGDPKKQALYITRPQDERDLSVEKGNFHEKNIDPSYFGAYFLFEILWGTQEDTPSHYQIKMTALERQDAILYRVASNLSSEPGKTATPRDERSQHPSFIFCMQNEMEKPLPQEMRRSLLNLNPWLTVEGLAAGWESYWLRMLHVMYPFSDASQASRWDIRFGGVNWSENRIQDFVNRLIFLQELLTKKPQATFYDILSAFNPLEANRYRSLNIADPVRKFETLEVSKTYPLSSNQRVQVWNDAERDWGGVYVASPPYQAAPLTWTTLFPTVSKLKKEAADFEGAVFRPEFDLKLFAAKLRDLSRQPIPENAKLFLQDYAEAKLKRGEWEDKSLIPLNQHFSPISWNLMTFHRHFSDLSALVSAKDRFRQVKELTFKGVALTTKDLEVISQQVEQLKRLVLKDVELLHDPAAQPHPRTPAQPLYGWKSLSAP